MKFIDRVKETTATTGTGDFVLAGAVAGFQSFAGYAVGERVPYCAALGAEWEVGIGTKAASSITRTTVTASSNGGALVNFSAGTKELYVNAGAAMLAGVVDLEDTGFDIWLCAGQSNMVGVGGIAANIDVADPRVFQFGSWASDSATYQKIVTGVDPLKHPTENGGVGPASWFSKTYVGIIPSNRKVLLVPVAKGGTYLVAQTAEWAPGYPGGSYYEMAISQTNAAIVAAKIMYPNSRFAGTIWRQGESDGDWTISTAAYAAALKTLISGFRNRITGASKSLFIIGGLVPEAIAARGGYPAINAGHIQVANETPHCVFVPATTGYQNGDNLHDNAQGGRILGCAMAGKVFEASVDIVGAEVAPPVPIAATGVTMAGPAGGVSGVASTNFTLGVTPVGGTITGTVVVTPADGGGGGTFAPTTASLTSAAPSATFTYMPASTGAKTISVTNNGSLANPANITYTATAAATAPATMAAPVATAGDTTASVAMVAPSDGGSAITGYAVTSIPAGGVDSNVGTTALTHTITGLVNGTAYTFTAKATNAVGTAATASPASNSVTPAAAAGIVKTRLTGLVGLTESGTAPDYEYTGASATYNSTPIGGVADKAMAADGTVEITIIALNASKPILGLQLTNALKAYTGIEYGLFADTVGYKYLGNSLYTVTNVNTTIIPASTDKMRWRRVAAVGAVQTAYGEVSKDAGSTWSTVISVAGVPGTLYIQAMTDATAKFSTPSGTGLA